MPSHTKLRSVGQKLGPPRSVKLKPADKVADPFYLSPEWRALMDGIIKLRGRACEDPEHDRLVPRSGMRIFGDHVIERKDGGAPLDARNVMLRCGACHTRKTMAARAARYHTG